MSGFYPFPRIPSVANTAWPPQANFVRGPTAPGPIHWNRYPAHPAPPIPSLPAACPPSSSTVHSQQEQLEVSDEVAALFARMEARRTASSIHRSGKARAASADADAVLRGSMRQVQRDIIQQPCPSESAPADMQLPAQEDAASRAAQRERHDARARQERLYGAHAADVRAREAVLNAAFDHAVRTRNPPLWPSVPLR